MNHTISILNELLAGLPIGTNLAMMHVFWALLSGQLLNSRGALFPALKAIGLKDEAIRRAWTALSKGVWRTALLIELWRKHVESLPEWKQHEYEGYKPVTADNRLLASKFEKLSKPALSSSGWARFARSHLPWHCPPGQVWGGGQSGRNQWTADCLAAGI